jgi:hypothetical protein
MADFKYKEYTAEEDKIYNDAIAKIREGLKNGLGFDEACSMADVADAELKEFIEDDALKIMIAEMHYAKGMPLDRVADALKVPVKKIAKANGEMLEDAGIAAAKMFRQSNPGGITGSA